MKYFFFIWILVLEVYIIKGVLVIVIFKVIIVILSFEIILFLLWIGELIVVFFYCNFWEGVNWVFR